MRNAYESVIGTFDLDPLVQGCYVSGPFHMRKRGGTPVRKWRRSRLTLICSLWLILGGGAAALACVSHPATDVGGHPLSCMDSGNPVVQGDNGAVLSIESRKLRSPSKIFIAAVHPAALGKHFASILDVPAYGLSWPQENSPLYTPASFQPVLRL
jgi:hypothetical protein